MKNEMIITKINKEMERIKNEVIEEFNVFEKNQLSLPSEQIYKNAYKISAINDLYYYFINYGFFEMIDKNVKYDRNNNKKLMHIYNSLLGMHTNILETLYSEHFNYDTIYTSLWEDIDLLVKNVFFDEII